MSDVPTLLRRARTFANSSGLALTTVSKRLFADHRRIKAIASGKSHVFPRTLKAALARLDALEAAQAPPPPTNRPGRLPNDPPPRRRRNAQERAQ